MLVDGCDNVSRRQVREAGPGRTLDAYMDVCFALACLTAASLGTLTGLRGTLDSLRGILILSIRKGIWLVLVIWLVRNSESDVMIRGYAASRWSLDARPAASAHLQQRLHSERVLKAENKVRERDMQCAMQSFEARLEHTKRPGVCQYRKA